MTRIYIYIYKSFLPDLAAHGTRPTQLQGPGPDLRTRISIYHTVDGRIPAAIDMVNTLLFAGFISLNIYIYTYIYVYYYII